MTLAHVQETVADELEAAYQGAVWSTARLQQHKSGVTAAKVDLTTLTNEAKVVP